MIKWKDAILRGPSQCISSPRKAIEIHESRFRSTRPIRCVSPKGGEGVASALRAELVRLEPNLGREASATQPSPHYTTAFNPFTLVIVSLMSGLHCRWKYDRHLFPIDKDILVRCVTYIWLVVWVERTRALPCEGHHRGEMIHTHFKWFKWTVSHVQSYLWCGMRTVSNQKVYFCPVCPYMSFRKDHAIYHSRRHNNEKPYPCHMCGKKFARRDVLNTHFMTHMVFPVHTHLWCGQTADNKKLYFCSICPHVSAHKHNAIRHSRTHDNEKPFWCSFCSKTFTQDTVSYVQSYIWCGKMRATRCKLYFCPVCPYSTVQKGHAVDHSRKHSKEKPFQCPICFKSFSQKSSLKTHCIVQHSLDHHKITSFLIQKKRGLTSVHYVQAYLWCGEAQNTGCKIYFCPVCPYFGPHKGNAQSHSRKHSKEKPFQCPICFKSFSQKSSLKEVLLELLLHIIVTLHFLLLVILRMVQAIGSCLEPDPG
ncbi:unnamed protein product, partial [Darwinula stevensoni]